MNINSGHETGPSSGPNNERLGRGAGRVWLSAQRSPLAQRRDRIAPDSVAHPARMLPDLAATIIDTYSRPGELVLDPMCGIGTTLVQAVRSGRRAVGIELESRWVRLADTNLAMAREDGFDADARVIRGDARAAHRLLAEHYPNGAVSLIVTSPPYGTGVHGQVSNQAPDDPIIKFDHHYATAAARSRANLAHVPATLAESMTTVLRSAVRVIRPGGHVVIMSRPWRDRGGSWSTYPARSPRPRTRPGSCPPTAWCPCSPDSTTTPTPTPTSRARGRARARARGLWRGWWCGRASSPGTTCSGPGVAVSRRRSWCTRTCLCSLVRSPRTPGERTRWWSQIRRDPRDADPAGSVTHGDARRAHRSHHPTARRARVGASLRRVQRRILTLHRAEIVDRFRPVLPRPLGTAPWHYLLGPTGAAALAAMHGHTVAQIGYRGRARALAIADRATLGHDVATHDVVTGLAAAGTVELTSWWSAARCARSFGTHVRPDAYLCLTSGVPGRAGWWETFLEYDTGTETLARLAGKLTGYHDLAAATGLVTPVSIWLARPGREPTARHALTTTLAGLARPDLVPVYTATPAAAGPRSSAADRVWLPVVPPGHSAQRVTVAELAARRPVSPRIAGPDRSRSRDSSALPPPPPLPPHRHTP